MTPVQIFNSAPVAAQTPIPLGDLGAIEAIPGWLHPDEQQLLYHLARQTPGPMLEIGPWLGRSTLCLGLGARSGLRAPLFTVEYGLSPANFRTLPDGRIGFFMPASATAPLSSSSPEAHAALAKQVARGGENLLTLRDRIASSGIDATLIVGDFRRCRLPPDPGLIFCDAAHDAAEVRANLPRLVELAGRGALLLLHDAAANAGARAAVAEGLSGWKLAAIRSTLLACPPQSWR